MSCPRIDLILADYCTAVAEKDVPELALPMEAGQIPRFEVDQKQRAWTERYQLPRHQNHTTVVLTPVHQSNFLQYCDARDFRPRHIQSRTCF
jgi:hypothetical protein